MNSIRHDSYTRYFGMDCRFWESDNQYILQANYSNNLLNQLDFKRYNDSELVGKMYKKVATDDVRNAYEVRTYCTYKGFKFYVESLYNGMYTIFPLEEAMRHFKDFPRQGYDPVYEAKEDEIEEIWEERKPIEGFIFDVEPVFYLKKKGNQ